MTKEISLREAREASGLSLREAAKLLKISHPYLSALELGHKPLREENERKVRKLYEIPSTTRILDLLPEDKDQFTEWLSGQVKWWDSRFVLPMVPAVTSLISDIYVEPFFRPADSSVALVSRELFRSFFADAENHAMLLSGGLGSGKSFVLRMLTVDAENIQRQSTPEKRFVPILVSLGSFSLRAGSLVQSLVEYYRKHGFDGSPRKLEQFFRQCLERGNALLLFDGLDEVKNHYQRSEQLALLQQHFENRLRRAGNKMIVSGQADAFADRDRQYSGFRSVTIEPWRSSQLFEGCQKWRWNEITQAERFWLVLQSNERLHNLVRWPLLFHLFTTLHSAYGLRAFEEMSSLFDACCQVLENSWEGARRSLASGSRAQEVFEIAEGFSWVRWRHFFIFTMQRMLARDELKGEGISLKFPVKEVQGYWDEFLAERGVERNSLAYARLEDVLKEQNRIGPIVLERASPMLGEATSGGDHYRFLDDSFGEYYAAKALINEPQLLATRVQRHLRDPSWENVIPFAIQELCRSDRTYERDLGEQIIQQLLSIDDALGLDSQHRIGRFAEFTAVRSIGSINIERHWEALLKPFLDSYLYPTKDLLTFDKEFFHILQILGEFSASSRVGQYLQGEYERLYGSSKESGFAQETKWRLLGAMAKVGRQSEFVVDAFVSDIDQFMQNHDSLNAQERVNIRRLLWSIRACGRVFKREDMGPGRGAGRDAIPRIQLTLRKAFDRICSSFEDQLSRREFSKFHYWHILIIVCRAQHGLDYREDLSASIFRIFSLIDRNVDVILADYPNRLQLLQFLKAIARHASRVSKPLLSSTFGKLSGSLGNLPATERRELEFTIELGRALPSDDDDPLLEKKIFESVYGVPLEKLAYEWRDVLAKQCESPNPDYVAVGAAATGIEYLSQFAPETLTVFDAHALATTVLTALNVEHGIQEFQRREEERYYTRLGSAYSDPVYDHLYNCLLSLSRRLPLKTK